MVDAGSDGQRLCGHRLEHTAGGASYQGWRQRLLVDFFSPEQIAERAVQVMADPEAFVNIRNRARQTIIERYDLHCICLPAQLLMLDRVLQGEYRLTVK